jgi:DNA invertase Pin-like site-specific DNA recombinase
MVWDIDRWSRKGAAEVGLLLDLLAQHDGRLVDMSMDTQMTGLENARIPLLMKAEIARTEVVNSQKRILRGKESQRLNGAFLGGAVPYGLAAVRSLDHPTYLVIDPEAAANIKLMAEWVIEGCSTTEVVRKLSDLGVRTSRNAAWSRTTVRRLLRSPHMIGQRLYRQIDPVTKKVISEDVARDESGDPLIVTDPILDEATFARVDAVLTLRKKLSRKQHHGNSGGPRISLLASLLTCSNCDSKLQRHFNKAKGYGYYVCWGCRANNRVSQKVIEDYLADSALSLIAALEDGNPILDEVGRRWMMQFTAGDVSYRNKIQGEADTIQNRLKKLRHAFYVAGTLDESDFTDMETDLVVKLAPIEAELATIPENNSDISPLFDLINSGEDLDAGLTGEGSAWAALEHHVRRSILRCIIDSVEVTPGEARKPGENIPERCVITFATADNSPQLAGRTGRILGKHLNHKSKVLATN